MLTVTAKTRMSDALGHAASPAERGTDEISASARFHWEPCLSFEFVINFNMYFYAYLFAWFMRFIGGIS